MDEVFKQYEHDYVQRILSGQNRDIKNVETLEAPQERLQKEMVRKVSEVSLDSWDYAMLERIRRDDMTMEMKFGIMRTAESLLKLYCHGMVRVLDYKPTFDELVRMQEFLDSPIYKQYQSRVEKFMTEEVREHLDMVYGILGIKPKFTFWEKIKGLDAKMINHTFALTGRGRESLSAKRVEALETYKKLNVQYLKNRSEFYNSMEDASPVMMVLPLMFAMGLSGAMMGHAASLAGTEYTVLYEGYGELNLGYGSGFDGSGFEGDYNDDFDLSGDSHNNFLGM
ncbi:MAG: hypothetical protein OXC46_07525 [Thaumarchaeota archaeon]|nr:hypothetical protein [Nitrososphaerota archaeon]